MNKALIALALVAGCGASERDGGNTASAGAQAGAEAPGGAGAGSGPLEKAVATARLTGLYEAGAGPRKSQLCIVEKAAGDAQFGIIVWGANMLACQGVGTAVREGERLTLDMGGDRPCRIDGTVRDGAVSLPAAVPESCSYYCGAPVRFAGVSFRRTGARAEDAMKAKDVLGEPLCAGSAEE